MAQEILVAGATGRTGKIIVKKLILQKIKPRVLVRNLSAAQALWGDSVGYHEGDVRDIQTLIPATSDVSAIISAIGAQSPVGKNCPKRVGYEGVANLVQAACAQGVRRFILVSSIAVTHPGHPMNHFGNVLKWKLKGEEVLRQSGLEYVIIRPGGLMDTPGGKRRLIYKQGDHLLGMISRADLAEICIQALQYPHPLRLTFEVVQAERKKQKTQWRPPFTLNNTD
ncbi:MAG: SDR family oxidoreductase [Brevefilum sp.]